MRLDIESVMYLVSRGADVSIRDREGMTPLGAMQRPYYEWWNRSCHSEAQWEQLLGLLGGFTTVKVIEAQADSLIIRVESHHGRFTDAEREARERDALTIPTRLFRGDIPEQGAHLRCERGLLPVLDEVWREARRRDLGIELTR
jgi:hypothetical protein